MTALLDRYYISESDLDTRASNSFVYVGPTSHTQDIKDAWIRPASRTKPVSFDTQVLLPGVLYLSWTLLKPLPLNIEYDESMFIISDDIFLVYGCGESLEEARADYIHSLTEYYHILRDKKDEPTRAIYHHLLSYLRPPLVYGPAERFK